MFVEIVPLKEIHAHMSWKWRNDKEIWTYTGTKPSKVITLEDELNWIRVVLKRHNEKRFAIIADGVYIGNTQLTDITNESAQLHIFIGDKNYWGKNIATSAVSLLLYEAKKLNLKTVYLLVNKNNIPAIKAYKKNGFKITKTNISDDIEMEIIL